MFLKMNDEPDSKVHGANMGPTWVLSAPDGPHFGPRNVAIRGELYKSQGTISADSSDVETGLLQKN